MYTLLIVDDEPIIRRGIMSLVDFSSLKIERVLEAKNGEEALLVCKTTLPDIILMDINMPKMDGITCSKKIKEKYPNVSIAILTGYDYFEYARSALRIGIEDYILKPMDKYDIQNVLKKILDRKQETMIKNELAKIDKDSVSLHDEDQYALIVRYVETHLYDHTFSLHTLADNIGFNPSYLSVVIKKIYGMPFQEYVTKKRMDKAKILLLTTDMKNYEVASAIGIEDVNYFSTKFKKIFDITPKQYKQKVIKNDD